MNSQGSSKNVRKPYHDEGLCYDSHKDLIEILESEHVLSKKLLIVDTLVNEFVKPSKGGNLWIDILKELMPHMKELFNVILEKCVELSLDNQDKKCSNTVELIESNLEMVINLLEILDDLLSCIANKNKISFNSIQNILLYMAEILYVTFLHCKESNNIYIIYFDSINEVLTMFKKANEVHANLLKIMNSGVNINTVNNEEMLVLNEILDNFVNIGILLSGMNVKALVDNWKGYTSLTQKYGDYLAKNMNLTKPMELLMNEILTNLKSVFVMDLDDLNTVTFTLKVGNFLVKVLSKFYTTFANYFKENCFDILWRFFIDLYSYTKSCVDKILNLINTYLIDALDPLIEKVSVKENVFQKKDYNSNSPDPYGYLLFINRIFKLWVNNISKISLDNFQLDVHLNNILCCICKSDDFMLENNDLYSGLVINVSILVITLNQTNIFQIEQILTKNIFNPNCYISLFTQNLWITVIRLMNPKYGFDVICCLIDKYKVLINTKFSNEIAKQNLSYILGNIKSTNSARLINKYPIELNLSLWRLIGLNKINVSKKDIHWMIQETVKYSEKFLKRYISHLEFANLIDLMIIISTMPLEENYIDLRKLSVCILQLWDMNFVKNDEMVDLALFDLFFEGLVKITEALLWKFTKEESLQITNGLKSASQLSEVSKILSAKLIESILNTIINSTQSTNKLISNIIDVVHNLLNSENVILKKLSYSIILKASKTSLRDELFRKNLLSKSEYDFIKNDENQIEIDKMKVLFKEQDLYLHKCLEWSLEPVSKKMKTDEDAEEISKVLINLKENVSNLERLVKTNVLETKNVAVISAIISDLNLCLK